MFLKSALIVFVIFFSNVALGAFADVSFLDDVEEMMVLFSASVMFVVAILEQESDRSRDDDSTKV